MEQLLPSTTTTTTTTAAAAAGTDCITPHYIHNHWSCSSSSSIWPITNATDVLQPIRLIVLHVHDTRDPSSERWNCVGENWPVILPEIETSTSIHRSFTCRKSATWDRQLHFPSKGRRAEDVFALKNPDCFGQV